MLVVDRKYKGLKWRNIHFVDQRKIQLETKVDLVRYDMYVKDTNALTLITDLEFDDKLIYEKFHKNTRYEIRRAEKEHVVCRHYDSALPNELLDELILFYNEFVDTKDVLSFKLYDGYILPYIKEKSAFFSVAYSEDQLVVLHIYYGDGSTIRLWFSASHFRGMEEMEKRSSVGRANRYLHWKDILYFKNKGYKVYDWGGYSLEPEKKSISDFKLSFGGEIRGLKRDIIIPISIKGKIMWKIRSLIREENKDRNIAN